jgi:diguanylate cyclase (GGDEF)-like protein
LDARTDPQLEKLLPGARRVVVQPLFADGVGIGAVVMEHPGKSLRIERRVVSMLGQFSSHMALSLRNAGLLEQVQHLAETDPLTGVANRRLFEYTLSRELHRANRNDDCVTLVMIDVDHFKNFNDTFGHQAGDRALQAVADALLDACREFDTVARYGGEEFAVILPGCSTKQSGAAAERLREAVAKIKVHSSITASAGVSTFPNNARSASMLIRGADEALYESKEAGRNRVTKSRRRGSADPAPLVSDLRTSA